MEFFAIDFRFLYDFNNTHYALFVSHTQYSYQLVANNIIDMIKCKSIPAFN